VGFASDLPQCPSSGVFHNCFGTWTSEDGDKYVGEIKDGKRHGQGTYKAPTHIPMEENTSVSTKMAKGKDKEPSPLQMAV
tara:strand:- start:6 stop:245 length:240 start_codon:yes stop_codon:yes gene_type:complete